LDSTYFIKPHEDQKVIQDFSFLIALVSAIGIFIFKRAFFIPAKLVAAVDKEDEAEKLGKLMMNIRRKYMVVWAMAEFILLLGVIQYTLTANFRQFLILGMVGFYSILISKPQENLLNICEEYIAAND
jgi:glucose-6-phosphate-specific signal transduction histidine kinase